MDPQDLATRYVAAWTEPDPALRRNAIEQLWTESGSHVLEPPEEVRAAAGRLGIAGAAFEARGYDAIEQRMATSYRDFIAGQGFTFRAADDARRIKDVVTFTWEAVLTADGSVVGGGLEFLLLNEAGQITTDYMLPNR
jgi:hypothetical protein